MIGLGTLVGDVEALPAFCQRLRCRKRATIASAFSTAYGVSGLNAFFRLGECIEFHRISVECAKMKSPAFEASSVQLVVEGNKMGLEFEG